MFRLDTEGLTEVGSGGIGLGETGEGPGGLEITFSGLREYTQLRVARDPGTGLVLAAAALILVGLLPALYSSRRKVWVRAEPAPGGSRLRVGGFALQRRTAFEQEFAEVAAALLEHPSARVPKG